MKARKWLIHCSDSEWGNETMERLAKKCFADDPSIDIVEVYEHAGWHLSWARPGHIVGTANDMAMFSPAAIDWCKQFDGCTLVGYERRQYIGDHQVHYYNSYWPKVAEVA